MPVTTRSNLGKATAEEPNKQVTSELLIMDHDSVACSGSRLDVNSKCSSSSKKAKAALLLAELKQRQIELDNSLRLAAVKNEVEMAKLQLTLAEDSEDERQFSPIEDSRSKHVERYLDNLHANRGPDAELITQLKEPRPRLDLPKVELQPFDGNPTDYWMFSRQFEFCVERHTHEPGQCLLYLMYYCKGKAKDAIKGCIMLDPEKGYGRARQILKERFGQPHRIARALIDGIFDGVKTHMNDAESLDALATNMQNCEISLTQMDYLADLNSMSTLERIVRRFPFQMQEQWAPRADTITQLGNEPSFRDLTAFIMERARLASSRFGQVARDTEQKMQRMRQGGYRIPDKPIPTTSNNFMVNGNSQLTVELCMACRGRHELEVCDVFKGLNTTQRWDLLKEHRCCFKCLRGRHIALGCHKREPCGEDGCRGRHHRLLHVKKMNERLDTEQDVIGTCLTTQTRFSTVQLGVVPVRVKGPSGTISTYAFLDSGSDTTLVKAEVLERLGIQSEPMELIINTVTGTSSLSSRKCNMQISSLNSTNVINIDEAYAVSRLPLHIRKWGCTEIESRWPHLKGLSLPVIEDEEVSILIGCDVPEAHWVLEQRIGGRSQPYATKTMLGWILNGPMNRGDGTSSINCMLNDNRDLLADMCKLYDQEFADVSDERKCLSVEETLALKIVTNGTKIDGGHYEVPMPWRSSNPILPDNLPLAMRRLSCLKRRFAHDKELYVKYKEILERHLKLGYAVEVENPIRRRTQPCWYLPHHPVINPKKPGKVRIVFDCAAKWNGTSLNDNLYPGPDTTSNICQILLRFRSEDVAVAADIEEMFLRVKVPEKDQDALRFLWWADDDLSKEPVHFKLTVHPFGATSSPFCANFALKKAMEGLSDCDIVSNCFYVDDLLTSFRGVDDAISFSLDLDKRLRRVGFKLRKWLSNKKEVLESVSNIENAGRVIDLRDSKLPCERALGIEWDTDADVLRFNFKTNERESTRRRILSCVSTLFDPLGLIAPLLLPARCLLQTLCRRGLGWDESISKEDEKIWLHWKTSMHQIGSINFQRCMKHDQRKDFRDLQLHIFCDASETGYGTAAYVRYCTNNGYNCSLIFGKARVAPIKTVTIPRLELTAAVMGIRVFRLITNSFKDEIQEFYFWTDSMIVLYYIRNVTQRFSTFVANRVSIIREYSEPERWKYVKSEDNPADRASRGCYIGDKSLDLWMRGPAFLHAAENDWPTQPETLEIVDVERKVTKTCAAVSTVPRACAPLLTHYSDWFKLLKASAWLLRYKDYLLVMSGVKSDGRMLTGALRIKEINRSEDSIIRLMQGEYFTKERQWLEKAEAGEMNAYKQLICRSPLRKLCPILKDGIIRVGGRLAYSNYSAETKHPIILPREHPVTEIIVRHFHVIEGHCGSTQLLAATRQRYWIPRGRTVAKRVVSNCMECRRRNISIGQQIMAPLPLNRVTPGWRAFNSVGIDYFGPLLVKKNRSMEKRYGCLFTCLQMRAVHIEIAHDLSTDSFLMAMMRFMGRRGTPAEIYSDNGSCFVGAETELKAYLARLSQGQINDQLLKRGVQWNFNPPSASHRGGVWERMIRSVRRLLSALPKEQTLNDEMLLTLMVEAERILNSRPIVSISDDHTEPSVLTPNSLILLHDNPNILVTDNLQARYTKSWKRVNHLAWVFWTRWTREYLPTLQARQKWLSTHRNFVTGDVVLVLSEPRRWGKWPLGIIKECEMDADGLIRTVLVKTGGRELRRDIRKLALLEGVE